MDVLDNGVLARVGLVLQCPQVYRPQHVNGVWVNPLFLEYFGPHAGQLVRCLNMDTLQ